MSLEYGKKSSPHSEKNVCRPMSYYGKAKFNDVTIYRKIKIMDGQLNITDFSEDSSLSEYKRWSSRKDGSKYSFSKGYKRFN